MVDLLRHEAGLTNFYEPLDLEDLWPENIRRNAAGSKIAVMKQRKGWIEK